MKNALIAATVLLVVGMVIGAHVYTARLNRQAEIRQSEIAAQALIERTEERAQFWQKLIPWGEDEDEQGN